MKKIGITGGIGSGKTTVCKLFEALDVPVYYADIQAKKILMSNASVKKQIKNLLGVQAYHKNGKPDRKYISSKVFGEKSLLEQINKIVHPAVQIDSDRWFEHTKSTDNARYTLKEAALMVETGSFKALDALIVVTCPEDIRIARVMKRDNLTHEEVMKKIKFQLPESDKIKVADYIIVNDGKQPLIPQVWEIHKKIIGG